jgi:excisionase family DNA binding protein
VPDDQDKLLTTGEVCAVFGVSRQTIRRYVLAGKLTVAARTLGGYSRFLESEVMALYTSLNGRPP